jgi:hypothetical protein
MKMTYELLHVKQTWSSSKYHSSILKYNFIEGFAGNCFI